MIRTKKFFSRVLFHWLYAYSLASTNWHLGRMYTVFTYVHRCVRGSWQPRLPLRGRGGRGVVGIGLVFCCCSRQMWEWFDNTNDYSDFYTLKFRLFWYFGYSVGYADSNKLAIFFLKFFFNTPISRYIIHLHIRTNYFVYRWPISISIASNRSIQQLLYFKFYTFEHVHSSPQPTVDFFLARETKTFSSQHYNLVMRHFIPNG